MMHRDTNDRFSRQADLVPQEKLQTLGATLIGVGAVGRQIALQLAAIGVRQLQLFDFDHVESTNITSQGYGHADLGLPKVLAMQQAIERIDPRIVVTPVLDRFRPHHERGEVVFCAVDKIDSRKAIWRMVGTSCQFWVDGRMLGENLRVLSASTEEERGYYATTLFPGSEAEPGRCTAESDDLYRQPLCRAHGSSIHSLAARLAAGSRSRPESLGQRVGRLLTLVKQPKGSSPVARPRVAGRRGLFLDPSSGWPGRSRSPRRTIRLPDHLRQRLAGEEAHGEEQRFAVPKYRAK